MAIKSGNAASASEAHKVFLKEAILALANSHKIKFRDENGSLGGSGSNHNNIQHFAIGNFLVDGFGSPEIFDSSNTTCPVGNEWVPKLKDLDTSYVPYKAYNAKDIGDFSDTNVWSTTGTVTAGGSFSASSTAISDGASGFDAQSFAGDSEIVFNIRSSLQNLDTSVKIQISNGSTHVDVHERSIDGSGSPPDTYTDEVKVKIDKSESEAFVSVNGGSFGAAIDISSATTNWYIRIITGTNSSSANVYVVGYVDADGSTVQYQSAVKTFKSTKSDAVVTFDYNSSDSDIQAAFSCDNGGNFSNAAKDTWTSTLNTGTQCIIRLTLTTPSSLDGDADGTGSSSEIYEVNAVGAYFNG